MTRDEYERVLDDLFAPTSDIPEVLLDESRWGDEENWQGGEE